MTMIRRTALIAPALGLAAALAMAGPAAAADGIGAGELEPVPLNGVEGLGSVVVGVSGTTVGFELRAAGLLADAPHAAHIHFGAQAAHECPTAAADTDGDELLSTTEGNPSYGDIIFSLTTSGDTSPASALAVDRFATGPVLDYGRADIEVSEAVATAVLSGQAVVVVHGIDVNDNGTYDMEGAGPSELDSALPAEATHPALCGVLTALVEPEPTPIPTPTPTVTAAPTPAPQVTAKPKGGVQTGSGSTAGVENAGLLGFGALALLTGGAVLARRRLGENR